jgi:hypothetical protein
MVGDAYSVMVMVMDESSNQEVSTPFCEEEGGY